MLTNLRDILLTILRGKYIFLIKCSLWPRSHPAPMYAEGREMILFPPDIYDAATAAPSSESYRMCSPTFCIRKSTLVKLPLVRIMEAYEKESVKNDFISLQLEFLA